MTSRQRLLAAARHEEVDRVPCSPRIWAWLLDEYGSDDWRTHLRAAEELGFDPHVNLPSGLPNPFYAVDDSTEGLRDVAITLSVRDDGDTELVVRDIRTPAGPLREIVRRPKPGRRQYGVNPNPVRTEHLIKDAADLERIRYLFPDPDRCRILEDYPRIVREAGERGLVQVTVNSPIDYSAVEAYGIENMMVDYYERREILGGALRLFQEHALAETRAVLRKGVPVVFVPWFNASLSAGWSPAMYRELFGPLLREHVELVHSAGALYDLYDDGKCMDILDVVAGCGVDVFETLTPPPVGDANLGEIKRRIGDRVCLKGGIDLLYVIKDGTPASIELAVADAIAAAAPGGGFILGSSDSIRDGTPRRNIEAFCAAARRYGSPRPEGGERRSSRGR